MSEISKPSPGESYHIDGMELTAKQVRFARDLIRLCNKHQIVLQAIGERISACGITVSKANPDICHILHNDEKKAGFLVSLTDVQQPIDKK